MSTLIVTGQAKRTGRLLDVTTTGKTQRVRYIEIDTPEIPGDSCSQEAKNGNTELVFNKLVCLEKDVSETDRYGRLLRYVYQASTFVNAALVRGGYAYASTYPPDVKYSDR